MKTSIKKCLAVVLVIALAASAIVFTTNKKATAADGRPDMATLHDCILYLTFDNDNEGLTFTSGGTTAKATVTGSDIAYVDDAAAGKGLFMKDGNASYLNVAYSDGSSLLNGYNNLTISYWSKSIGSDAQYYGWTYFAKKKDENADARNYIGAVDRWDRVEVERCLVPADGGASGSNGLIVDSADFNAMWKFVTVVYDEFSTKIYINGDLKAENECSTPMSNYLTDNSELMIGYAPWGSGEYYQGYIDEFSIMSYAMNDQDVKTLFNSYSFDPATAPTIEPSPTPSPTPLPTPTKTPRPTKTPKPATEAPKATDTAKPAGTTAPDGKATIAPSTQATPTAPAANTPATGTVVTVDGAKYKVLSADSAAYTGPASKTVGKAVVPASVNIEGKEYRVTEISDNAFAKCKRLTKITIGPNVTKIGKKAFAKCSKLKAILVQSKGITSVGKGAFSGIYKKAVFTFPKAKFNAYKKKTFKGKGQKKTCKYKKK